MPIAGITFKPANDNSEPVLYPFVAKRTTNRNIEPRQQINQSSLYELKELAAGTAGASIKFVTDVSAIDTLADTVAVADKLRLMHPVAHTELYHELRWNDEDARSTGDGVDIETLDLTNAEKAGFTVAADYTAVKHLTDWKLGSGFEKLSLKLMRTASAVGLITMPEFDRQNLLEGGRLAQRLWLHATRLGLAFQPQMSPPFFFTRLLRGGGNGFPEYMKAELAKLRPAYREIWGIDDSIAEVFMFRLFISSKPVKPAYRLPLHHILHTQP